jgi:hypothetical protein
MLAQLLDARRSVPHGSSSARSWDRAVPHVRAEQKVPHRLVRSEDGKRGLLALDERLCRGHCGGQRVQVLEARAGTVGDGVVEIRDRSFDMNAAKCVVRRRRSESGAASAQVLRKFKYQFRRRPSCLAAGVEIQLAAAQPTSSRAM